MANKKETPIVEATVEETTPEVEEINPLEPQPNDTSSVLAYKRLLADYKTKNPKKFESKKEGFIQKLQGEITMEEVQGQNGKLVRRTFKVPSIQTKRVK